METRWLLMILIIKLLIFGSNCPIQIQAVLVEFDIGEDLAVKFSQILPSALILAALPFMVLR